MTITCYNNCLYMCAYKYCYLQINNNTCKNFAVDIPASMSCVQLMAHKTNIYQVK